MSFFKFIIIIIIIVIIFILLLLLVFISILICMPELVNGDVWSVYDWHIVDKHNI